MCAHVCACWEKRRHEPPPSSHSQPRLSGDVINGTAGAVFPKVRHSSPKLMFSAPVGRFFFFSKINPSATCVPPYPGNLLPRMGFSSLTPGRGKLQCSGAPLQSCPVTQAGCTVTCSCHEGLAILNRWVTVSLYFLMCRVSCHGLKSFPGIASVSDMATDALVSAPPS